MIALIIAALIRLGLLTSEADWYTHTPDEQRVLTEIVIEDIIVE